MADDRDATGLGGWLAFFLFAMAGLTPVMMIFSTWSALYVDADADAVQSLGYWTQLQLFEWSLAAITIAGCWFIAARLVWWPVWRSV